MEDKSLQLLTEEELDILKRFEQCTTFEELKQLEREVNLLNENKGPIEYEDIDYVHWRIQREIWFNRYKGLKR